MKKKNFLFVIIPIVALVLEVLPWGVVMNFANPDGKPWRYTYSYFDMMPFGYAIFPPLLVAICTCVLFVLTIVYVFRQNSTIFKAITITNAAALILSLAQFLYGLSNISAINVLVTLLFAAQMFFFVGKGKPQQVA